MLYLPLSIGHRQKPFFDSSLCLVNTNPDAAPFTLGAAHATAVTQSRSARTRKTPITTTVHFCWLTHSKQARLDLTHTRAPLPGQGLLGEIVIEDRTFRSSNRVLRARFAKMIVLGLGLPASEDSMPLPFSDVPKQSNDL